LIIIAVLADCFEDYGFCARPVLPSLQNYLRAVSRFLLWSFIFSRRYAKIPENVFVPLYNINVLVACVPTKLGAEIPNELKSDYVGQNLDIQTQGW